MCITHTTQNFCAPRLSWYSFGGIWRGFQPSHLKNHEFHFFTKLPTKPLALSCHTAKLAMCKTHTTKNFSSPRVSWYSFGDICWQIQPSHLKNHEFYFLTKLPTKPSTYVVPHCQTWPCAKPTELKTFVHQYIHGIHLWTFVGHSNLHISKTMNFNFSQNSSPIHLAKLCYTAKLGYVQKPPNLKLSCIKTFMVFIWGHLKAIPSLTYKKPRISFF